MGYPKASLEFFKLCIIANLFLLLSRVAHHHIPELHHQNSLFLFHLFDLLFHCFYALFDLSDSVILTLLHCNFDLVVEIFNFFFDPLALFQFLF